MAAAAPVKPAAAAAEPVKPAAATMLAAAAIAVASSSDVCFGRGPTSGDAMQLQLQLLLLLLLLLCSLLLLLQLLLLPQLRQQVLHDAAIPASHATTASAAWLSQRP